MSNVSRSLRSQSLADLFNLTDEVDLNYLFMNLNEVGLINQVIMSLNGIFTLSTDQRLIYFNSSKITFMFYYVLSLKLDDIHAYSTLEYMPEDINPIINEIMTHRLVWLIENHNKPTTDPTKKTIQELYNEFLAEWCPRESRLKLFILVYRMMKDIKRIQPNSTYSITGARFVFLFNHVIISIHDRLNQIYHNLQNSFILTPAYDIDTQPRNNKLFHPKLPRNMKMSDLLTQWLGLTPSIHNFEGHKFTFEEAQDPVITLYYYFEAERDIINTLNSLIFRGAVLNQQAASEFLKYKPANGNRFHKTLLNYQDALNDY